MKRSEMRNLISDNVLTSFFPDLDLRTKNLIADCILVECQLSGMKSPHSEEVFQKNAKIYIEPSGYEWDPE